MTFPARLAGMRLIAVLVLGAFLALVGVSSAHAHDSAAAPADACAVCALAQQAQRQAPAQAPSVVAVFTWTPCDSFVSLFTGVPAPLHALARAPPRAS